MEKEKSEWREWTKALGIALILVIVIRYFLFAPIVVDGLSMTPTLHNGDRMIVSKFGTPDRFDIVVFHAPERKDYIKRVIGLPGDKIEYKDDTLYINGKAYEEPYLKDSKAALQEGLLTDDFTLDEIIDQETVPDGEIFVMGDNRRYSKDSRHIGTVPLEEVVGITSVVVWPIKDMGMVE
ncbi:signal peptidase I [Rossellomorea marisflavi]|uniref:Signal peptidase I n=1 Tax=Rossellomorea marisflavi TaxID=189381 RepID=A0A5D4RSE9_9BACI|nr:signal peptidase I [Rossellomorea marisflavi]KQU60391.1 S26 family signal peptidase [Bacillus sp. Leaf406]MBV6683232.1 signal peptidase I [Bacillus sp. JRC01]TYS53900.1 signal peptidase I [Rossellomorea marisflavi]WJV17144.1 signal peptidase I [Rossellomorea marisflavi]